MHYKNVLSEAKLGKCFIRATVSQSNFQREGTDNLPGTGNAKHMLTHQLVSGGCLHAVDITSDV